MLPRRPAVLLLAELLLLPLVTPNANAALPPAATEDAWIVVGTRRFHVYSNAGETQAVHAARHLERLADTMERIESGLRVDSSQRVSVYLFRDAESFRPYVGSSKDEYSSTAGYHVRVGDADDIAYFIPPDQPPMEFAAHEFTHSVVDRTLGALPVWTSEGLAEYFSTFESQSARAQIGRSKTWQTTWLRNHLLPLRSLLLIGQNSPEYSRGQNRVTLYAESWALVHMLIMDERDQGHRFDALLSRLATGVSSSVAMAAVFGPDAVDSLESELRLFSANPAVSYIDYKFETPFERVPAQVRPLDRVETLIVLGELLTHAGPDFQTSAEQHLKAAWSADSTRALSAALLGEVCEQTRRPGDADRWFDRVSHSDASGARARGIAGNVLAQRRFWGSRRLRWPAPGADESTLRARTLLAAALKSDPDNAVWLADYGMTFLDDSLDVSSGIGALMVAQEAWPRRCDIVAGQSILNLRAGNRGAAVALYNSIPQGLEQPRWRFLAGWLIADAAHHQGADLVRRGHGVEAESLFARCRREVDEKGVAEMCDSWLAAIHEHRPTPSGDTIAMSSRTEAPDRKAAGSDRSAGEPSGSPSATNSGPLARGLTALESRDYATAEAAFEQVAKTARSALVRARANSLSARARNLRRIDVATDLLATGKGQEACLLLDLVLSDQTSPDLKREAARIKSKACKTWR